MRDAVVEISSGLQYTVSVKMPLNFWLLKTPFCFFSVVKPLSNAYNI